MTIVLFFAVLFVLILVHEWGHFIVAKKTGMRVDEFGIGFPPKLFGIKKGGTEYTLNLFPIGGFVKIFGENAVDAAEESMSGGHVDGSFTSKSKWSQAAVLVAGVTMNIIFAWFLIVGALMIGLPTSVDESTASDDAVLAVTGLLPDSPATEAGLPIGASILSVSAGDITQTGLTPSSFKSFTLEHASEPLTLVYEHNDEEGSVTLEAVTELIEDAPEQPAIGVAFSLVETVSTPFLTALKEATVQTGYSLVAITKGICNLAIQSVRGEADFSQVAGPIGIAGLVGDAAKFGLTSLMMFTAVISLNLAVINMFPFPALDGGRLIMVAVEAVTRRPIAPVWVARINTVGFLLLMLLMITVTFGDVMKLF